jgi:hypothetical protein
VTLAAIIIFVTVPDRFMTLSSSRRIADRERFSETSEIAML